MEAKDAAAHLTMHRTGYTAKNHQDQMSVVPRLRNLAFGCKTGIVGTITHKCMSESSERGGRKTGLGKGRNGRKRVRMMVLIWFRT